MIEFQLPDMSCGHCERAVNQAVHEVDPAAQVTVDLAQRTVHIDGSSLAREVLAQALSEAGYPPA